MFFAWSGGRFVLLHALEKKGKTPESELKQAEREYKDWK
ncbi:MAG: type II toxin-antitoxin system RelE/ParE family toxin [Clostridia bacterium]|nr:type II toxin-antitoxin system RelE/ParE family toxin [Clostridia bacterium]